jgi:hypothetical protein
LLKSFCTMLTSDMLLTFRGCKSISV